MKPTVIETHKNLLLEGITLVSKGIITQEQLEIIFSLHKTSQPISSDTISFDGLFQLYLMNLKNKS